jgi:hypothetical protein
MINKPEVFEIRRRGTEAFEGIGELSGGVIVLEVRTGFHCGSHVSDFRWCFGGKRCIADEAYPFRRILLCRDGSCEREGNIEADAPRASEEIEAQEIGAEFGGEGGVFGAGDAADFYADGHGGIVAGVRREGRGCVRAGWLLMVLDCAGTTCAANRGDEFGLWRWYPTAAALRTCRGLQAGTPAEVILEDPAMPRPHVKGARKMELPAAFFWMVPRIWSTPLSAKEMASIWIPMSL